MLPLDELKEPVAGFLRNDELVLRVAVKVNTLEFSDSKKSASSVQNRSLPPALQVNCASYWCKMVLGSVKAAGDIQSGQPGLQLRTSSRNLDRLIVLGANTPCSSFQQARHRSAEMLFLLVHEAPKLVLPLLPLAPSQATCAALWLALHAPGLPPRRRLMQAPTGTAARPPTP